MTPAEAVEKVLATALAELGVREVGGPNRGPRVETYLQAVHWRPGAPWCAAFVGWCGRQALGDAWPLPMVPGTWTLLGHAQRHGWVRFRPERGHLFFLYSASRKSWHTGFVVGPAEATGAWSTIEGNTGPDGGHDGDGVYARTRRFSPADRFIEWTMGLPQKETA